MANIFENSSSFLQIQNKTKATTRHLSFVETAESSAENSDELTGIQKKEVEKLKSIFG